MTPKSHSPLSRAEQAEQTRARILVAGGTELASRGYAGTSLARIAARASVSKATILMHFGSKENLYWTVAESQLLHARPAPFDFRDLAGSVLAVFTRDIHQPEWTRFRVWEGLSWSYQPELMRPPSALRQAGLRQRVVRIGELQEEGRLPKLFDPSHLALFLHTLGSYPHTLPQVAYMTTGAFPAQPSFRGGFASFVRALLALLTAPSIDSRADAASPPPEPAPTGVREEAAALPTEIEMPSAGIPGRGSAAMRLRIVESARIEFVTHGYDGASIGAIALRAGVSKGTVAYAFKSKEALFEAVADFQLRHELTNVGTDRGAAAYVLRLMNDSREIDWLRFQLWEGLSCRDDWTSIHGRERRVDGWRHRTDAVREDQELGLLPHGLDAGQLIFFLYVLGTYPHIFPYAAYSTTGHYPSEPPFHDGYTNFAGSVLDILRQSVASRATDLVGSTGSGPLHRAQSNDEAVQQRPSRNQLPSRS